MNCSEAVMRGWFRGPGRLCGSGGCGPAAAAVHASGRRVACHGSCHKHVARAVLLCLFGKHWAARHGTVAGGGRLGPQRAQHGNVHRSLTPKGADCILTMRRVVE